MENEEKRKIELGIMIKNKRIKKGLTIRDLQKEAMVSNAYLSQIENGKRGIPSPDILQKISKALDINYYELLKKAGYIVSIDSEEEIRRLQEELSEAYKKINELEKGYELISHIIMNTHNSKNLI